MPATGADRPKIGSKRTVHGSVARCGSGTCMSSRTVTGFCGGRGPGRHRDVGGTGAGDRARRRAGVVCGALHQPGGAGQVDADVRGIDLHRPEADDVVVKRRGRRGRVGPGAVGEVSRRGRRPHQSAVDRVADRVGVQTRTHRRVRVADPGDVNAATVAPLIAHRFWPVVHCDAGDGGDHARVGVGGVGDGEEPEDAVPACAQSHREYLAGGHVAVAGHAVRRGEIFDLRLPIDRGFGRPGLRADGLLGEGPQHAEGRQGDKHRPQEQPLGSRRRLHPRYPPGPTTKAEHVCSNRRLRCTRRFSHELAPFLPGMCTRRQRRHEPDARL